MCYGKIMRKSAMHLHRATHIAASLICTVYIAAEAQDSDIPGISTLPDGVTPDMLDSKGRYWVNQRLQDEAIFDGLGTNDKRIWDEVDKKDDEPKSTSNHHPVAEPGACTILQSGILECDGVTQTEAADAATQHLASQSEGLTCPEDGDVCPVDAAPTEADEHECPPGWLRLDDACYDAAYRMRATQRTARHYCRDVGGPLIHPVSGREAAYFLQFFHDVWVGAEYSEADERWQWLDGQPLPANVSLLGGLKPEPARRCVRLHTASDVVSVSFVKTDCGAQHPFVCRAPLDELLRRTEARAAEPAELAELAEPTEPATGGCPARWTQIAGWCHLTPRLVGEWSNGELWCNHHRASKLVTLLSRGHELAVDALVGANVSYHIGMRYRRAVNNWGWMTGDRSQYRNWKHGADPTWAGGDRDVSCAFRHAKKDYWVAAECRAEKMFVCAFKLADQSEPAKPGDTIGTIDASNSTLRASAGTPKSANVPDYARAPKPSNAPDSNTGNTPTTADTPKATYTSYTADTPKAQYTQNTADTPKTADTPNGTDTPYTADTPKVKYTQKTADPPNTADTPKATDMP